MRVTGRESGPTAASKTLPAPRAVAGPTPLTQDMLRMLLVEDSFPDSALVLTILAQEMPQAVIEVAADLDAALLRLGEHLFHAVLVDLALPDADGNSVVQAVRAAQPDTAVLVLTGRMDGELGLWALAAGAQDYLIKDRHDGPRLTKALLDAVQHQQTDRESSRYLQLARGLMDALEAPTCAVGADGRIVAVNQAWLDFSLANGGDRVSCGEGSSYLDVCDQVPAGDVDSLIAIEIAAGLRCVLAGEAQRFQQTYACSSAHGSSWFSVRITPADVDGSGGAVVSHVDVTDMHDVQQALAHQALHDGLTGLPNRLLLTDRISQALLDRGRRSGEVAVAFLDLDHFKRVNDSFGHPVGDALLVQVAERLSERIRATDTLARLSGDEFVVVWRDLNTPDDALALSEMLVEALLEPFDLGGPTVNVSASVGLVVACPTDDVEDLLHASDAAMYEAKGHGGNRVRTFTDALRDGRDLTLAAEADLRDALARSELVLHYQPVIDLASGRAVAVEALVRWQHPEQGLLAPAQFIPVAESSGLIVPLGRWVLDQACKDAAAAKGPLSGLDVAVNLSVRQLTQSDVVTHVRDALQESGLDPRRLLLEVTESAVVEDAEVATATLEELSRLGVRVALDDFGTGYSSLLYLRLCPISALKLDRGFVAGIGVSADDEAICSSVVSLAHAVGATSIAEGVETLEQYAALREVGCRQAQGFLWSPAVSLAAVPAMLRSLSTVTAGRAPALAISRRGSRTEQLAATARGTRAIAVAAAAETAAQTAAQTAVAVQRQADASAAKVAAAASRAATSLARSVDNSDPNVAVTAARVAAIVAAAAVANAEETVLAAAIVARAVAAAAADAALTESVRVAAS